MLILIPMLMLFKLPSIHLMIFRLFWTACLLTLKQRRDLTMIMLIKIIKTEIMKNAKM